MFKIDSMGKTKEQIREDEEKRLKKVAKLNKRKQIMKKEMEAAETFMKIIIWFKYQWLNVIIFSFMTIIYAVFLGLLSRLVWEIWKIIFALSV